MRDADAFAAVYDREARTVLGFVARRTPDPELARDLTAETFAQAFRGRHAFRGSTHHEERAWLLTIARRQIATHLRRGRVERRALQRLGGQTPRGGAEDEVLDLDGPEVRHHLSRLSADQRAALLLRVVEERPYPEVADRLGVSEQTARARVSRGLRALARALEVQPAR
jgi:RNA polymerase sigma factor (sigma-70 family)